MKFRVEHKIEGISLADYEQLYFDEAFNIKLCQEVKLERELLSRNITNGKLERAVKISPDRELPAPVAKILGAAKIAYTEHVTYQMGSYKGAWHTISSIMSDKIDSAGTLGFNAIPGGVMRWVEGEIKVKIFGLGGMVEKLICSDVEKSYEQAAEFTRKWLKR